MRIINISCISPYSTHTPWIAHLLASKHHSLGHDFTMGVRTSKSNACAKEKMLGQLLRVDLNSVYSNSSKPRRGDRRDVFDRPNRTHTSKAQESPPRQPAIIPLEFWYRLTNKQKRTFWNKSIRFTSGCWIMGTCSALGSLLSSRRPCFLSRAYCKDAA